jgi:hypothetical protein
VGNWLLDVLVLYGRQPWRPLVAGLIAFLIGAGLFRASWMKSTSTDAPDYDRYWYSLDLLVPGIDLGIAKNWRPDVRNVPASWYFPLVWWMRVQQALGWLVIPIGVAAIAGVFK